MTKKEGTDHISENKASEEQAKNPLQEENNKLKAELSDLTDTLKRLQAEFENYRKRCDRESTLLISAATGDLVKSLLNVLDNFELALSSSKEGDFKKGMELIYAQLYSTLENEGLTPIKAKGEKFDPRMHEALIVEEHEGEPNIVLEELQKGYLFNGKVLRHSKVKISKRKTEE